MKLYATTTSERATKGQGGNEYIDINITDESGARIAEVRFQVMNGGKEAHMYASTLTLGEDNQCIETIIGLKGKKQKGEPERTALR